MTQTESAAADAVQEFREFRDMLEDRLTATQSNENVVDALYSISRAIKDLANATEAIAYRPKDDRLP